ncbi:MAG: hypothetical protein JXD22_08965 [Sedimentisphaerales bacterium]|nr:hypothetical protein [Sedimentisphaerales bacterium]
MKIRVCCNRCGYGFSIDGRFAGRAFRCSNCNGIIKTTRLTKASGTEGSLPNAATNQIGAESAVDEKQLWPGVPEFKKPRTSPEEVPTGVAETVFDTGKNETAAEGYEPEKAFRQDLLRFISPIQTVGELSTFICLVILFVGWPYLEIASSCCCAGFLIKWGCVGCLCSFMFNIITETAEGCDELPYLDSLMEAITNPWTQIIVPLTNFLGALFYGTLPSLIAFLIYSLITKDFEVSNQTVQLIFSVLSLGGLFFWPMVALILAYDQLLLLLRPDIIFRSIIAIWKPYLIAWVALLIVFGVLFFGQSNLPNFQDVGFELTPKVFGYVGVQLVCLIVFIYAMRVIGLLYRHFDDRLSWAERSDPKHPLEKD